MPSQTPDSPPAAAPALAQTSARLPDPLLDGALHLFALVAQEEKLPRDAAVGAVREQLHILLPPEQAAEADRLTDFFTGLLAIPQGVESVCAPLLHAAVYEDRIYVLLMVLEFRGNATRGSKPVELPDDFPRRIGVEPADFHLLLALHDDSIDDADLVPEPGAQVRVLSVTDKEHPGALWLPAPGLRAVFIAVGRTFFVARRRDGCTVRLGRRDLPKNTFLRIRDEETVAIGGRHVSVPDLRYYFRQSLRPRYDHDLHVQVADGATIIGNAPNPAEDLSIALSGVTPVARMVGQPRNGGLLVNGETIAEATPVWLSDKVRYAGRRLRLRKLILHAQHDTFAFSGPEAVCTVSNDPQAPIYVHDVAACRWNCRLEASDTGGLVRLLPGDCPHPIQIHHRTVTGPTLIQAGDVVRLAGVRLLVERGASGALEITARDDRFSNVSVEAVTHRFANGGVALDDLNFEIQRGDLVCVLGPSGSGKSTLLNVLNGTIQPAEGDVRLDNVSLHTHPWLQTHIGFVPQDDLLQENLTVRENLLFAARLRWPQETADVHALLVDAALGEIDLVEKQHSRIGNALEKSLSGGQRKRVNIGLELVGRGGLLLLDEPTSGLSAGDTRKIVEVLRRRADDGDIVFVVAHQPSARVLSMFDKVLILDKGGRLAFFGHVEGCYRFFGETLPAPADGLDVASPAARPEPGMIFEALEQPRVRIDGSPDPERRYPPAYWKGHYRREASKYVPAPLRESAASARPPATEPEGSSFVRLSRILLHRECLNKLRGRVGLLLQLLSALFLGFAAAYACRFAAAGVPYAYSANQALPNYMFLTVIVCLFMAVSGSVQEIIRDRAILLRERMLSIPFTAYLQSKFIALLLIYLCQLSLYLLVGFWVLEIPQLLGAWWLFLAVVGCAGIGLGLAISTVPTLSERAAAVLVPLVIIPQIILSGAKPFPFEDMQHLKTRWEIKKADKNQSQEEKEKEEKANRSSAPSVAQVMPSRWALEGLIALHRDHSFTGEWYRARDLLLALKRNDLKEYQRAEAALQRTPPADSSALPAPEHVRLWRIKKSGDIAEPETGLDVPVRKTWRNGNFYDEVNERFAHVHRVPGTAWNLEAALFNATVLLSFTAGFLLLAVALQALSTRVGNKPSRRRREQQQTVGSRTERP